MSANFIVGLDVGSQNIKAAIAEVKKDGKLALIALLKLSSGGIRRGLVNDTAEVIRALTQAMGEIKKISKSATKNIFLSVGSHDVKVQASRGIVAVSRADSEIHQDDVDRVVEASQAINLPPNRMILHSLTQEYVVDSVGDIHDPLGMIGSRLEVNSLIVDAFAPAIKDATKCVEMVGGSINGLVFSPLAASRAVLSRSQKELGVVLIDIGFGKTGISIYEENKLVHAAVTPIGSGNVTNDLAVGMKCSVAVAEMVKFSFGSALAKEVAARELVDLRKIDPTAKGTVTRRLIAEVIEARLAEIMEFVDGELKKVGRARKLPAGAIIVGGGAKVPGIVELARQELHLSAQIGVPDISAIELVGMDLHMQVEDPEFTTAIGLIQIGSDRLTTKIIKPTRVGGFFHNLFKHFIP